MREDTVAVFIIIGCLLLFSASCYDDGHKDGRRQMFRDIANQRCAPGVALISDTDPYRYVCVPK